MPEITLFVSAVKSSDNSIKINVVNDLVSINRAITKPIAPIRDNLAKWILSQIDEASNETSDGYEGVFTIDYHVDEGVDEDGNLTSHNTLYNVSVMPLPAVLRRDLDAVLLTIDGISNVGEVKVALKQLAKAVSFLHLRGD